MLDWLRRRLLEPELTTEQKNRLRERVLRLENRLKIVETRLNEHDRRPRNEPADPR